MRVSAANTQQSLEGECGVVGEGLKRRVRDSGVVLRSNVTAPRSPSKMPFFSDYDSLTSKLSPENIVLFICCYFLYSSMAEI